MQLDEQCRYVARAVYWRHWVGEDLQEVRVTRDEQDVLETVVEVTETQTQSNTQAGPLYCNAINILASQKNH